ncbi:MAG: hypothetical protein ACK56F_28485, partial [bacterium]
ITQYLDYDDTVAISRLESISKTFLSSFYKTLVDGEDITFVTNLRRFSISKISDINIKTLKLKELFAIQYKSGYLFGGSTKPYIK